MKSFRINTNTFVDIQNFNLAIGNFDGVHVGHKNVIEKLVNESKQMNIKSAILSFNPHPRQFFSNNYEEFNIQNEKTKIQLIEDLNVDYYINFEFNSALASYSAEEFVNKILFKKLKIKHLTVGYDFKFGKDRKGNISLLKKISSKYNFNLTIIDQVIDINTSEVFSSSLIRSYIKEGNFKKVSYLLGRNWTMQGKVITGDKRAREMNFPTANILPDNLIKPRKGVYAVKVRFQEKLYNGIANFGERPTVEGKKLLLEVHLFEFNQNIYGEELTIEFLTFIRDEKKFENFKILTEQIQKDIQLVKKYQIDK